MGDNEQFIDFRRTTPAMINKKSAIQCHGNNSSQKPDYTSSLTFDDFRPFIQNERDLSGNDPILNDLLNYLQSVSQNPVAFEEIIVKKIEIIKNSEKFLTEDDPLVSSLPQLRKSLQLFDENSNPDAILEKFRSDIGARERIIGRLLDDPKENEIFQNTPGSNMVERFENYLSGRISRERALIESKVKKAESELNKIEDLLRARAAYALNGDSSVFNPYLPTRRHLSNNPKELAVYEDLIKLLMQRIVICWGTVNSSEEDYNVQPNYNREADKSSKYLICASIAELFYNRPDLVELVTASREPFEVILVDKFLGKGGIAFSNSNRVVINNRLLMLETSESIGEEKPFEINPVTHEFLHKLDNFSKEGQMDGNIPGLSRAQSRILEEERIRFTNIHDNFRLGRTKEQLESIERESYDPATGLPNYTFSGREHFVVVTSTLFHRNPAILKEVSPKLFDLYCDFYRFDPSSLYEVNK